MKNKLFLIALFSLVKIINLLLVTIDNYGVFIIIMSLILYKFSISFYIFFITVVIMITLKFSNPINNALCIDKVSHSINMNTAINIKEVKNHNSIYVLNKIVDEFINGFEVAALDPRKFKIKEGEVYKFRTHGAIYVLFEKKVIRSHNKIINYDINSAEEAVRKVMEDTKLKLLSHEKLNFSDKVTFLIERMLVQTSFFEMLSFLRHIDFEDIQVHRFEAVFKNKKVHIKSV
ncbi:hypothetical protein [Clostridium ljungdahlii]|uniref:Uncharacterized protein n=1 Tax=Clostridium ljungdahlii TaxID=1538 RepID=A0A162L3T5_9CLOT|nr:hypothetical protein [Clostridium ljungdahlii]OAA90742.1 hypothetical protein WY13_01046 [Clostridium ljungdahlii]